MAKGFFYTPARHHVCRLRTGAVYCRLTRSCIYHFIIFFAFSSAIVSDSRLRAEESAEILQDIFPASVFEKATDDLPVIMKRKWIRALVTFSKTDFFLDKGQPKGFQVEYLKQYENFLNKGRKRRDLRVRIIFIPVPFERLIPDLIEGKGDIAATFLTITPERRKKVAFATGNSLSVDEIVVTGKKVQGLKSIQDLSGRTVYVLKQSSYAEHLRELNQELKAAGKPPVNIREADSRLRTEDILEMVNADVVTITVADDIKAKLWSEVLPDLVIRNDLKVHSNGSIGWAVRKNNPELLNSLKQFTRRVKKGTLFGNIVLKRYYKDTRWIRNPLAKTECNEFCRFMALFRKYGKLYNFDYLAIAAQAFQESGFDQSRRSHRGAIGIMQLLPSTASDPNVRIPDIENVENNIHAGVKYLAFIRDRYFSDPVISDEDRLAFSWAAYNAGPRNVRRMQLQARRMGLNPNKWFQNVEYAAMKLVGRETVRYVANIYKYYIAYKLVGGILDDKEQQTPWRQQDEQDHKIRHTMQFRNFKPQGVRNFTKSAALSGD